MLAHPGERAGAVRQEGEWKGVPQAGDLLRVPEDPGGGVHRLPVLPHRGHREDFFSQREKTPLLSQLEPVLRAAAGHKLRRVCLLSSVDLEEEGLLSPALEELRAGERVLLSHCRERRLPVLLLRTGCVFGEAPPD